MLCHGDLPMVGWLLDFVGLLYFSRCALQWGDFMILHVKRGAKGQALVPSWCLFPSNYRSLNKNPPEFQSEPKIVDQPIWTRSHV